MTVTTVFGMMGLAVGTWAARIPAIKDGLHLSAGILGLALLGPAVGSVLSMPATGAILASVPPRRVVQVGLVALGGLLAGPAIIGGLAEVVGLPAALGTVVVLSGLIAVLAHFVLPRQPAVVGLPPPQEILIP